MTANGPFAVHSLDHARLSARKFAQQHVFPHISAALSRLATAHVSLVCYP